MNSLVADYGSDSESEDSSDSSLSDKSIPSLNKSPLLVSQARDSTPMLKSLSNGNNCMSDTIITASHILLKSTEETTSKRTNLPETPGKIILPKPEFVLNSSNSSSVKNSVFSNPYREAEDEKSAILEKHVKMIPSKAEIKAINGKSICWMYRKGRCRFGHNCKFAHDSDVELSTLNETAESDDKLVVNHAVPDDTHLNDLLEEGNGVNSNAKRKRPGLSQTLVPGKKVMKIYNQHKQKR